MKVDALYRGGKRSYPGTIMIVNGDGTCDIAYDDGEREDSVKRSLITPTATPRGSPRLARQGSSDSADGGAHRQMAKGDRVEARYRGKGTKFYKGKISRVNSDDTFDIAYDDGEREIGIAAEHVRSLEPRSRPGDDRGGGDKPATLMEGDKVEARYKGRSRYYPGRIARVHRDGTCDIDYDDGEKERMVEPALVRAVGDGQAERVGSDRLEEGMKVEARYKGRSRYYPGRIARVHRDGTCDIDYDDGEKERMVEPALVRAVGDGQAERVGSDRLEEGMKVEARYKGRSRYYPGRIARVHRDGTCDIDYDDGEKERMVEPALVRAVGDGQAERVGSDRLEEGMKVEARYKGRSRYYPGRIARVHR
ncbi:unnamed protein product, partial [Pylaiella littoralis]